MTTPQAKENLINEIIRIFDEFSNYLKTFGFPYLNIKVETFDDRKDLIGVHIFYENSKNARFLFFFDLLSDVVYTQNCEYLSFKIKEKLNYMIQISYSYNLIENSSPFEKIWNKKYFLANNLELIKYYNDYKNSF